METRRSSCTPGLFTGAAASPPLGLIALTLAACGTGATRQTATTPGSTTQHPPAAAVPTDPAAVPAATRVVIDRRATAAGEVLVNGTGRTLYTFAADRPGHSACTGACATAWPPVIVPAGAVQPGPAGRRR